MVILITGSGGLGRDVIIKQLEALGADLTGIEIVTQDEYQEGIHQWSIEKILSEQPEFIYPIKGVEDDVMINRIFDIERPVPIEKKERHPKPDGGRLYQKYACWPRAPPDT